jgi:tetratricopeptide (TPR) repeat protein
MLASLAGCTCQGSSSFSPAATDAGSATAQPPAEQPPIPERAMQLHSQGRRHGEKGEFELALRMFHEAQQAAPTWPLPLYDMGLTFLYMKADAKALETFTKLEAVAPQGISDSKRMVDSLRKEQTGRVPKGTLREFVDVMKLRDIEDIRRRLETLTQKAPAFAPAWAELARISSEKPQEAERLADKALSLEPDSATRAELLVYKATLLWRRGGRQEALKQLQAIRDDPSTPPQIAAEARELLGIPENVTP